MTGTVDIFGLHAVRHALQQSPENILEIWVQENKRETKAIQQLLEMAGKIDIHFVNKQTLDQISGYERHQGILIRREAGEPPARQHFLDMLDDIVSSGSVILVLDGIQDPHNLGACLRTADAAGVRAVIIPRDKSVSVNTTVIKVAAGAAENVPVFEVTNLARTLRQLKESGLWIVGTSDSSTECLFDADLNRPIVLVMGAEGKGMRENTRKQCDLLIRIPMQGIVESLNISVACGICLYEVLRQRRQGAS